ncbi:hypothetical protein SERLA73DRAFT_135371 [Serpula lacrymans var. lacrymans S7.3]|uniref:Uncharacterized protein n=2 Tax=Serpula lacrymans var. lacrymans TaxID=341189 RepID=F8PW24_SERL3|nr:uncharacterized protein SERLADRAFT_387399 [Serpula lacrymans var. lacrymans S7.9]EGN99883.1 hypothetical protein SERLA73DRAFT_135371 [Serpula lacrymans var. lacrymans S7.3]EGO25452.1 hypothetical protein SERLADRAFT_387399 [Serpula lacrymans var. lacrymans S7.9]
MFSDKLARDRIAAVELQLRGSTHAKCSDHRSNNTGVHKARRSIDALEAY